MMNFLLCSPNGGFPLIGLGVGGIATVIWMAVDPSKRSPDERQRNPGMGLAAFDPPAASLMRATCLQNRRKPMTRRITCITKHPNHEDRHRRIQAVGGYGWKDSEDTAIANVKRDPSAYEVTEHDSNVAALCHGICRIAGFLRRVDRARAWLCDFCRGLHCANCPEKPLAMSEREPERNQIAFGQVRYDLEVDVILDEQFFVLAELDGPKPGPDFRHRSLGPTWPCTGEFPDW